MKIPKKISKFFFKKEYEKEVLNKKRLFVVIAALFSLGCFCMIFFKPQKDTSVVINSIGPISKDKSDRNQVEPSPVRESKKVRGMLDSSEKKEDRHSRKKHARVVSRNTSNIKYKAPQVIERNGVDAFGKGLPVGANLLGKLLTGIDTRETERIYKVLLPYGGKDKNGGNIPKNSVLFGSVRYPGKGKKVFLQFSRVLLPDGREVKLEAQALSSKDYSPGLVGNFHGKATERVFSTLGLAMVSAMTDTLTERQSLGRGEGETISPKATAKNAFYQGLSRASEMEAERQAGELSREQEYVTVPAGREMIVNLLATYHGEK